jgi:hypothetical protein
MPGLGALVLEDPEGDRRVAAAVRDEAAGGMLSLPGGATGLGDAGTDGHLLSIDEHAGGALRLAWAEGATELRHRGRRLLAGVTPGRLGVRPGEERLDLVAENRDAVVEIPGLPFTPRSADGACALHRRGDRFFVELGRERRVTLRADAGSSRPAADPGRDRRVAVGETVTLDATASCDAEGQGLAPSWELVSAPPGSEWVFERADRFSARLLADRPGPYRVRLVVTDASGLESRPAEVLIVAGEPCEDRFDGDYDGLIDSDDPDCDLSTMAGSPPIAEPDAYAFDGGSVFEPQIGVLANDEDPDGEAVTAVLEEGPAHGQLLLLADGHFFYEPDFAFAGQDHFTYRARDATGEESAAASVSLEVAPVDTASLFYWSGGLDWAARGSVTEGDLAIDRDRWGGVRRVHGAGAIGRGDTALDLDFRRFFRRLFWGRFELRDPALPDGSAARRGAIAQVRRWGEDGVRGWALSLHARPPFLFYFEIRDRR